MLEEGGAQAEVLLVEVDGGGGRVGAGEKDGVDASEGGDEGGAGVGGQQGLGRIGDDDGESGSAGAESSKGFGLLPQERIEVAGDDERRMRESGGDLGARVHPLFFSRRAARQASGRSRISES